MNARLKKAAFTVNQGLSGSKIKGKRRRSVKSFGESAAFSAFSSAFAKEIKEVESAISGSALPMLSKVKAQGKDSIPEEMVNQFMERLVGITKWLKSVENLFLESVLEKQYKQVLKTVGWRSESHNYCDFLPDWEKDLKGLEAFLKEMLVF